MDARQRVKLTSTNDPFGLAWVLETIVNDWVESEVPSDTHALRKMEMCNLEAGEFSVSSS